MVEVNDSLPSLTGQRFHAACLREALDGALLTLEARGVVTIEIVAHPRCDHQWIGNGCARPVGHEGHHFDAARQASWTDHASDRISPWERCAALHPTARARCFCVLGHGGKHYALTVPLPVGEPTHFEDHPHVEWGRARR